MINFENNRHLVTKASTELKYNLYFINHDRYVDDTAKELWKHTRASFEHGNFEEVILEIPNILGELIDLAKELL